MVFTANTLYYQQLNAQINACSDSEIVVENLLGQRYVGCGSSGRKFRLYGTPGNGLGQYLNGSTIEVFGNAQDAAGEIFTAIFSKIRLLGVVLRVSSKVVRRPLSVGTDAIRLTKRRVWVAIPLIRWM